MANRPVGPRHIYIPDLQCKPGVPLHHIAAAARYVAEKTPDVVTLAGDVYDLPSLSSYDEGKRAMECRRLSDDLEAGRAGLALFDKELLRHAKRSYAPRKIVTIGNHEQRLSRYIDDHPKLAGQFGDDSFAFAEFGWEAHQFLRPVTVHGITYLHYCPLNSQGRVSSNKYGAPSALAMARRMMRTTVAGHRQGVEIATVETPGRRIRGVIAGSFYCHDELYLGKMGNSHWRGILVFNDIQQGDFDLTEVSLDFLLRKYG